MVLCGKTGHLPSTGRLDGQSFLGEERDEKESPLPMERCSDFGETEIGYRLEGKGMKVWTGKPVNERKNMDDPASFTRKYSNLKPT